MAKQKAVPKKAGKRVSPYNKFMKEELGKVKAANPGLAHKEAFKKAAQNWATSPDNPKRKTGDAK